jgi:hypothetical protein
MITITSSNSLSAVNGYQPTPAVQSQGNTSTSASGSASASDTVQLSLTAQATAMQQEGMSVAQIASSMDLTTAEVDSYLGIATSIPSVAGIPSGGGARNTPAPTHSAATAPSGSTPQPTSSQPTKT